MVNTDIVQSLIQETVTRYISPSAQVRDIEIVPMGDNERGWSGAQILRYRVHLQKNDSLTVITKTMLLKERRVMHLLMQQGHANIPFTYTPDLTTDDLVLVCMQDLDKRKVEIQAKEITSPTIMLDLKIAHALAAIHVRNLGQQQMLSWLSKADRHYIADFLLKDVWRSLWERTLSTDAEFAREFAVYTPLLEKAADSLTTTVANLWKENTTLTLTHGEIHGEHVMIFQDRPYFIDWDWAYYGPLYLDLPTYFTPLSIHYYREALAKQGVEISQTDFMERYHEIGRYVGFKYLCTGIWQWGQGPTAQTGQRLLQMLKWAIDGTQPELALTVSPARWSQLLEHHRTFSDKL